jgi:hypothetical protein
VKSLAQSFTKSCYDSGAKLIGMVPRLQAALSTDRSSDYPGSSVQIASGSNVKGASGMWSLRPSQSQSLRQQGSDRSRDRSRDHIEADHTVWRLLAAGRSLKSAGQMFPASEVCGSD